jgi:hypothetical protein
MSNIPFHCGGIIENASSPVDEEKSNIEIADTLSAASEEGAR